MFQRCLSLEKANFMCDQFLGVSLVVQVRFSGSFWDFLSRGTLDARIVRQFLTLCLLNTPFLPFAMTPSSASPVKVELPIVRGPEGFGRRRVFKHNLGASNADVIQLALFVEASLVSWRSLTFFVEASLFAFPALPGVAVL